MSLPGRFDFHRQDDGRATAKHARHPPLEGWRSDADHRTKLRWSAKASASAQALRAKSEDWAKLEGAGSLWWRKPTQRVMVVFVVIIATVAVLVWTPPFVSFVFALAAGFCWCLWLERRPTA